MKNNLFILALTLFFLTSCVDEYDGPTYGSAYVPIEEAITPEKFIYNSTATITIKYKFPNSCYSYDQVYYQPGEDPTSRIVAVIAAVENTAEENCSETDEIHSKDLTLTITQREDYLFKFWKGNDENGEPMYEEITVPVETNN